MENEKTESKPEETQEEKKEETQETPQEDEKKKSDVVERFKEQELKEIENKKQELLNIEKRVDEKLDQLEEIHKQGNAPLTKKISKDEKVKAECNEFLEKSGLGLKI
jgi:hypothetical protein